jgi:hypothetical protein
MKYKIYLFALSLLIFGCEVKKSFNKDLITGLTTKGDGISADEVFLSVDDKKIERNTFIYGEVVYLNFNNIGGLIKEGENVFPGMQFYVTDKQGTKLLYSEDLYSTYTEGISFSPLELKAHLTVAKPIHSNNEYTLFAKIWDKKGKGTFTAEMDFNVKPNDKLKITTNGFSYDEVYLYSEKKDKVITDNKINFGDNIYAFFEGLSGMKETEGTVFPGMSLLITDNKSEVILNYDDLFNNYSEDGVAAANFNSEVSANFWFTGSEANNPLQCEIKIWDKRGESDIRLTTLLMLE